MSVSAKTVERISGVILGLALFAFALFCIDMLANSGRTVDVIFAPWTRAGGILK